MNDKQFEEIKKLLLSNNEEDNMLAVNILRAMGEDVKGVIYDSISDRGFLHIGEAEKYFKTPSWGNVRNIQNFKLHDKYEQGIKESSN